MILRPAQPTRSVPQPCTSPGAGSRRYPGVNGGSGPPFLHDARTLSDGERAVAEASLRNADEPSTPSGSFSRGES
jgi:hypothetical protein